MNFKVGICPDEQFTFGNLAFVGLEREKKKFDQALGRSTDIIEKRIYNVISSVQKESLQVSIPDHIDLKEFEFQQPVKLQNPKITARAQSNGNFANVVWTLEAEDIIPVDQNGNRDKKIDSNKPVINADDKK